MSTTPKIPDVNDWLKHPSVSSVGTKGFNPNEQIPKLIKKEYSWARAFDFAFSSKEDIPSAGAAGWIHLRKENFDPDTFNQAVSLRFGIGEEGGVLKSLNNYIMIRPIDESKRVLKEQNDAFEENHKISSLGAGMYTDKDDPEAKKLRERLMDRGLDDIGLKEEQFSVNEPKRRGRPPKN